MKFKFTHHAFHFMKVAMCATVCHRVFIWTHENEIDDWRNEIYQPAYTDDYPLNTYIFCVLLILWPCKYSMKNIATEWNEQREKNKMENKRTRSSGLRIFLRQFNENKKIHYFVIILLLFLFFLFAIHE